MNYLTFAIFEELRFPLGYAFGTILLLVVVLRILPIVDLDIENPRLLQRL